MFYCFLAYICTYTYTYMTDRMVACQVERVICTLLKPLVYCIYYLIVRKSVVKYHLFAKIGDQRLAKLK